jgi:flagellum-specific peptidoglycan hydrolase FlgJ
MDLRKDLAPYAQEQGQLYSILPSFIMAVAWLETGGGKSSLCKNANNLFSIKGDYHGNYVTMPTTEYYNGKRTTVNARFRKYPSYRESCKDFCELIKNGVSWNHAIYSKAVIGRTNIYDVINQFSKTPYMTDPAYSSKLLSVVKTFSLMELDKAVPVQAPPHKDSVFTSIVDYLKSKGMDSSFSARKALAAKYKITNYVGSNTQNVVLLKLIQGGK